MWPMILLPLLFLLFDLVHVSHGGNILVWMITITRSQFIFSKPLAMALARRNHSMTIVTPYSCPALETINNVKYILLDTAQGDQINSTDVFEGKFYVLKELFKMQLKNIQVVLDNPDIKYLMKHSPHFDVCIIDGALSRDLGIYLAKERFKSPIIIFHSGQRFSYLNLAMGNPTNPSYIPDVDKTEYSQVMTFVERLHNTLLSLYYNNFIVYYHVPMVGDKLKELLHLDERPDLNEMIRSASFLLYNDHPVFESVVPINPNTAYVGGMHIEKIGDNLMPEDLATFLDEASDGVILVSFGSLLTASQLSERKRNIMLNTFSKLKQKVIWKWETDEMVGKPENVLVKKWLPQQEILAHKNLKLFITHGGLLSTMESLHYQVPMIVMPVLWDQFGNAARAERMGFEKTIRWENLDEHTLLKTIQLIFSDRTFKEKADFYGTIFKDNIVTPLDKAVYHTEFIMRHKGAPHLRSPAKDLYWFQYFGIDVFLFLIFCIVFAIFLLCYFVKKVSGSFKKTINGIKEKREYRT